MAEMIQVALYDKNTFIVSLTQNQMEELGNLAAGEGDKGENFLEGLICEQLGD